MEDFEVFIAALESDHSYTSDLTRGLSLALEEFYKNLTSVVVSSHSGEGMKAFFKAIDASAEEYMENCKADLDKRRAENEHLEEEWRRENMEKLRNDMEKSGGQTVVLSTGLKDNKAKMVVDYEEADDDDEEVYEKDYGLLTEDDDDIEEEDDEEADGFAF